MPNAFRFIFLSFLSLSLVLIPMMDLSASYRVVGRRAVNPRGNNSRRYRNYDYPYSRWFGWEGNAFGWPSYYAYYGYPIVGSTYYYSFPTNSSFYYSYPSYSTQWTYPSYPYVGKFYVNNTPVNPRRLPAPYRYFHGGYSRVRPSSRQPTPQARASTSVFINE